VRLANDANCFALSEAADGAGRGAQVVFGVILGTGCGGGIVVDGRPMLGRHHISGEWGHNPLPRPEPAEYPGPLCWCGRCGCLELWVSGSGLERDHLAVAGRRATAVEIERAAGMGDAAARASLERHAGRLARGLAHVVNIVDPDVIVLGGGLSNMRHLYDVLPTLIAPHVFADRCRADTRPPAHGAASGARGAARLWQAGEVV
jgi:fructokinase